MSYIITIPHRNQKNEKVKILISLFLILGTTTVKCQDTTSSKVYFYGKAGIIYSINQGDGYLIGFSIGKDKHNLSLQYQKIGDFSSPQETGNSSVPLGVTIATKSLSLMYDIKLSPSTKKNISLSVGLVGGSELYRTNKAERFISSCGAYSFFCTNGRELFKFHYKKQNFVGAIISFKIYGIPKRGFIGGSAEPFIILNNHSRITFGLAYSILIGKSNQ